MTECVSARMRDLLPDYVHGNLGLSEVAEVDAHLASCAECAAELDVLRSVFGSAPTAPAMDTQRIVRKLPTPGRPALVLHRGEGKKSAPTVRRRLSVWSEPWLRVAAAVAIVVGGALSLVVGRDVLNPESSVAQRPAPVAVGTNASTSASPVAAEAPSNATPVPARVELANVANSGLSLVGDVQDLSDEHLAALIEEIDDMSTTVASEPESLAPAIATGEVGGEIQ